MRIMQSKLKEFDTNPIFQNNSFGVSDKYKHYDSNNLIKLFENHNLELSGVSYGTPRKEIRRGFQKHLMVFTRDDLKIDDNNYLRLLATNSHDGTSALTFNIGIFRTICANGLIAGNSYFEYKVKHIGNSFDDRVNYTIEKVLNDMPLVAEKVRLMQSIELNKDQIKDLKIQAARIRLKNIKNVSQVNIATVGNPRRQADMNQDLYTVFNRIQETAIKGGMKYKTLNFNDNQEIIGENNNTTRKIKSIVENKRINTELWNLAEKLAA